MNNSDILHIIIPSALVLTLLLAYYLVTSQRLERIERRIARVTRRRSAPQKSAEALSLRKTKAMGLPVIGKLLQNVTSVAALRSRLERAGFKISPDIYIAGSAGAVMLVWGIMRLLHKPLAITVPAALVIGIIIPNFLLKMKGAKRIKKFLSLFPDAIDFIVRGLRSGLPATESMNMVGAEMEQPIGGIFADIGESVRLGVPLEKALMDTAKKLESTEFNFFVTCIILQRETGGNLSEILSNLADVLRKRFMMRMKIKAMSSEAKSSAIIVGALPFVVSLALSFLQPGYLAPLIDDPRGNMAVGIAAVMMLTGMGIMMKMSRFEI